MKITNGNWLIQEHLEVMNALCFFEGRRVGETFVAYVAPRDVSTRGAQVDVPIFTYTFFSRQPGTIGVRIEHFRGRYEEKPQFETAERTPLTVQETAQAITLRSGDMEAVLQKEGAWRVAYRFAGEYLTSSDEKGAGYAVDKYTKQPYVFDQLHLGIGELVFGLGERFTHFVKNGQTVDLWNRDGGTGSEQAYKNVPFYITNRNYGVFIDQPDRVQLEIGSEKVSAVQFSVPGESLSYEVIGGHGPKEVLRNYTAITGRAPELPAWSFGLWLSTSFTTNYDEATVSKFIEGMKERNIPLSVFHFDCFWMKGLHWTDFVWDKDVFPDPPAMLRRLHEKGLRVCVWINPYISQLSRLFDEGKAKRYFVETSDGAGVWQWDRWQPAMALVDFTNPEAVRWYQGYLEQLVDMGVDCFKTDFGERIPTEGVRWHDGSEPGKMHNYYSYLYNKVVFDVLRRKKGEGKAILFARSGSAGSQKFPVHWGGDSKGNFDSLAETLRGGLSLALSGFAYWSHDMGGFENTSPASVYKRWCQFGLLSSHSRLHGSQSYRVPWAYDEEAVAVLRRFTKLKCRLMPYLWQTAEEAHLDGVPMLRPMLLEFPEDLTAVPLDRQYMLGGSLLVAPVLREDGKADYYLPEGAWTHLLTGEQRPGGCWQHETYDYMSLPLFVRENTIVPLGGCESRTEYDYLDGLTLFCGTLTDGADFTTEILSLDRQTTVQIRTVCRDGRLSFTSNQPLAGVRLKLAVNDVKLVEGEAELVDGAWRLADGATRVAFALD